MTTNRLDNAGLNSNPLGKMLRSNAPESKRFFHSIRERLMINSYSVMRQKKNILTKRIASLLFGERKKKGKMH